MFMSVCVLKFATDAFFRKYFCAFISPLLIWEVPEEHNTLDFCPIYKIWIEAWITVFDMVRGDLPF